MLLTSLWIDIVASIHQMVINLQKKEIYLIIIDDYYPNYLLKFWSKNHNKYKEKILSSKTELVFQGQTPNIEYFCCDVCYFQSFHLFSKKWFIIIDALTAPIDVPAIISKIFSISFSLMSFLIQ